MAIEDEKLNKRFEDSDGVSLDLSLLSLTSDSLLSVVDFLISDSKFQNLTGLNLLGNQIGEVGARIIAEHLPNLTDLNVRGNQIGEIGARAIAERLSNLLSLDLGGNHLGEKGARAIADRLTNLTSLVLWNNQIGGDGALAIAARLTQLLSLDLGYNRIRDAGAIAIAERLGELTMLDLGDNQISDTGAIAIAERLTNLITLNLWENKIGPEGARAIADRLTRLTTLELRDNHLGEEGVRAIAKRLPNVTTLDVKYNHIGNSGASAIAVAIRDGYLPKLTLLWLQGNDLTITSSVLETGDPQQIANAILGNESTPADYDSPVEADAPVEKYLPTPSVKSLPHIGAPTSARDEPASVDYLNREPWLVALATMFASPKHGTPFTLALFGDWGGGKSSLLRMLKDRLRKYAQNPQSIEFDFAEFNAWEYEKTDNIAAGLAQEVVRGIVDGYASPVDERLSRWRRGQLRIGRWIKRCRLAMNFAAREHGWTFYRYPIGLLAFSLIALACWYFPSIPAAIAGAVPDALKGAKGGLAALIPALIGWPIIVGGAVWMLKSLGELLEHPLSVELHTFLQLPGYKQHLGTVPVLKQQIRTLCGMRLGTQGKRQRRLVVFVDDLDRCSPECIVSTLEAVRLVMDLEHVIVMIAVDPRIALQAVGYHYRRMASKERSAQEIAREYLAKIIQLSIQLPPLEAAAMETYIEKRLFDDVLADEPTAKGVNRPERQTPETAEELDHSGESSTEDGLPVARTLTPNPSPGGRGEQEVARGDGVPVEGALLPAERRESPSVEHVETQALLASLQDRAGDREAFRQAMQNRPVGFHNPRRLLRLRNAFRLLKVVALASKTQIEHRELITQLFEREQARMDSQGRVVPSSGDPILDAMVEAVILPEILQTKDEPEEESPEV